MIGVLVAGGGERRTLDLVARYGDFVLYDPPVRSYTLFLWGGPFLFMLGGAGILVYQLRKRRKAVRAPEMDAEAQRRAAALADARRHRPSMSRDTKSMRVNMVFRAAG